MKAPIIRTGNPRGNSKALLKYIKYLNEQSTHKTDTRSLKIRGL